MRKRQNKLIELGKLCNYRYRRNNLIFGVGGGNSYTCSRNGYGRRPRPNDYND